MSLFANLAKLLERPDDTQSRVERTVRVSQALYRFWSASHGWAPDSAAKLLAEARLDRQAQLALTLSNYLGPFDHAQAEARQILGYVTLRSMCEGALKLFVGVWFEDYQKDSSALRNRKGALVHPVDVSFDRLIWFFSTRIGAQFEGFLRRVQQRGNGIHAFAERDIGQQSELIEDIRTFADFLLAINSHLPYPDDTYDSAHA